jgi:hypothetical protein
MSENDTEAPVTSGELVEIKLSDRVTVSLVELNGLQTMNADRAAGQNFTQIPTYRALYAIRKFNGQDVEPAKNDAQLKKLAGKLRGRELDKLVTEFLRNFADLSEVDLKNG